ncbi:hypothetical protein KP79_PYT25298 [Mizuhopecten yessoensis]|uniref:Uncharacterized protein n=1 Tax=Mizuhopecten yessoensis TaxID=6573 RepID=A0A210PLK5_MIZYE|nr:hypothetical protein KP79_PYT25298 [Mizuhopecten yessoensis]
MADRMDRFEALEQQLEMFIENTRQLGIVKFKTLLLVELDKVFPKEINTYRALRGDDRPL